MIEADKRGPLAAFWRWFAEREVRRAFRGVYVGGAPPPSERSVLVYANHRSWWDGFAVHTAFRALGLEPYAAMDEANLERFRFLRRIGAFSIRPGDPRSAVQSFRYAHRLLARPRSAVIVFPEGELRPGAVAPLRLSRGIAALAAMTQARCVPVAFRYAFFENERPDLLVCFGAGHEAAPLARFEEGLNEVVTKVDEVQRPDQYTCLVEGTLSPAERWRRARARPPQLSPSSGGRA